MYGSPQSLMIELWTTWTQRSAPLHTRHPPTSANMFVWLKYATTFGLHLVSDRVWGKKKNPNLSVTARWSQTAVGTVNVT